MYPKYVHERVNFFENQMLLFFTNGIAEYALTQNFRAKKCAAVCTLRRCLFLVGGVFCQHIAYGAARGQGGAQGADVLPRHRRRRFFAAISIVRETFLRYTTDYRQAARQVARLE